MRLLLDTHIWIWSLLDPSKLGHKLALRLESDDTELWLSPMSTWEALVLIERGRLEVEGDPSAWVAQALEAVPLHEAPITHHVAIESRRLRTKHADPADRFIAATAKVYDLTLVTADKTLLGTKEYGVMPNR